MSFISYYFHWSRAEVEALDHNARRRWCEEISTINSSLDAPDKEKEKNIWELGTS